ncbi:MAG: DNA repair and recombination protein RadB [Candidatus Aenigmarchaeota archaeon]|nr:DNA repair and recombination protein RadB [Candidatus Aenigmarchaeota archaeon]
MEKTKKLPFNAEPLDELLNGGIEYKSLTNIYGPAGAGKTNLAILASVSCIRNGKKVIFIDTEGGLSIERLQQIVGDMDKISNDLLIMEPKTFKEQDEIIKNLEKKVGSDVGLIVVDSLVSLYRLELGKDNFQDVNRKLANQLAILSKISREKDIPVLITNQVYSSFDNGIEIVSRDISKYWSKCLIELVKLDKGRRMAILRKHRSLEEERSVEFVITEKGIERSKKKFNLF